MLRFLREFFHKDHKLEDSVKVVIMSKEKLSNDVQQLISLYEDYTHLIVGSPFNQKNLEKADVKNAKAVFILSNQYDNSGFKSDSYAVLASKVSTDIVN